MISVSVKQTSRKYLGNLIRALLQPVLPVPQHLTHCPLSSYSLLLLNVYCRRFKVTLLSIFVLHSLTFRDLAKCFEVTNGDF